MSGTGGPGARAGRLCALVLGFGLLGPGLLGPGLLAAPAQACALPEGAAQMAAQFLSQANGLRARAGLAPLRTEARLGRAAEAHACDNARRGTYTHVGSDGAHLGQRLTRAGYPFRNAAENTGWGFRGAGSALHWWMSSPPHRANLMNPALREAGVGIARGGDGKLFWVVDLGAR